MLNSAVFKQIDSYSTGSKLVMLPGWSEYILQYIPKLTQKKGNTPGEKESSGHTKKMEYGKMFYTKADKIQTKQPMSKATPRQKGATKRQIHRSQIKVITTDSVNNCSRGCRHKQGEILTILGNFFK